MKPNWLKYLQLALLLWLAVAGRNSAQAAPARRPLPPLNTKRGLYIAPDGTKVYKDPLTPKKRVYTYQRNDGRVVQKVGGLGRSYGSARPRTKAKPRAKRQARRTRRSSRRR